MASRVRQIPLGTSDFRKVRQAGAVYVDKSHFITDVLDSQIEVLLLPRPRRFGKTMNLSMLRYFVEKSDEDRSALFAGLTVWESEAARRHFQRHPVIALTFKDVKAKTWADCQVGLAGVLARCYEDHLYLLKDGGLAAHEEEFFRAVLHGQAEGAHSWGALLFLSRHLQRHHGEQVFILIDEYDTPLHAAFTSGYYDQAVEFFRNFLSGGLKDNPHLHKGVLTGILRVAKESIFSGLNNLAVYSLLSKRFSTAFGFTEEEIGHLAADLGATDQLGELSRWYNGYLFGGQVIYNPWSVLSYLSSQEDGFRPYWVSTSSNDLLMQLLFRQGLGLRGELLVLLSGGALDKPIEEETALRDLEHKPDAIWSFLLFSGYLKARDLRAEGRRQRADLLVPNEEVAGAFEDLVRSFLETQTGGEVDRLLRAMLGGDERTFEDQLGQFLRASMSYHDAAGRTPERVYHAFVLGLLVSLRPRYEVRSNTESGYGRCDVMVLPRAAGQPGVVLELKTLDAERGETVEQALGAALRQVEERQYRTVLLERGASPIHEIAAVFDGKRVWVRRREVG